MEVKTFIFVFLCLLQCGTCMDYPMDIFEQLENKILNIETSMFQMKSSFNLKLQRLNRKTVNKITKIAKRELSNIIDDKVRSGEIQKTVDSSFNTQLQNFQQQLQQMKNAFRLNSRLKDNRKVVKNSKWEFVGRQGDIILSLKNDIEQLKNESSNQEEFKISAQRSQSHLEVLKKLSNEVTTNGILIANVSDQLKDLKKLSQKVNSHEILIANVSEQLDDLEMLTKEVNTHGILIADMNDQLVEMKLNKNKKARLTSDLKAEPFFRLQKACEVGEPDLVKDILSTGQENINQKGKLGRTPVMTAARSGQYEVFTFLVSQGCNLTTVDHNQDNVLHLACKGGNGNIVREVLENDHLGLESRGKFGLTPVMCAALFGHTGLVELLDRRGSDLLATDNDNDTILHVATYGGHLPMVRYILSKSVVGHL